MPVEAARNETDLRRGLMVAAFAYAAFVVYGSLVPLQYQPLPLREAWDRYVAMPFSPLGPGSRVDWGVNMMLFMPLGFLVQGALTAGHGRSRWWVLLVLAPLWPLLAGSIEFGQLFFPPRTTALHDIVAESIGGVIGSALWLVLGESFAAHASTWARARHQSARLSAILYAYALVFAFYQLMPLDLTASLADLHEKWAAGRVNLVPFGHRYMTLADALTDLLGDVASWIPLGFLAAAAGASRGRIIVAWCGLFAVLLELAQLLVFSRSTDVTDIFLAIVGAAAGVLLARVTGFAASRERAGAPDAPGSARLRWSVALLYGLALPVILAFPWDFNFEPRFVKPRLEAFWDLPLRSQVAAPSELHVVGAMANRLMLSIPLGLLLALAVNALPATARRLAATAGVIFVLAVGASSELVQVFVPSRRADLIGVFLVWIGALVGAVALGGWPKVFPRGIRQPGAVRRWAAGVAAAALALLLAVYLPGVPYNVRELLRPEAPALSALLLALAIGTFAVLPSLVVVSLLRLDPVRAIARWPLLLLSVSLACALMIALAVPAEAVADVVGSPVLGGWDLGESLFRLAVLIAGILWLLLGGGMIAWPALPRPIGRGGLLASWVLVSLAVLPFVYLIVVSAAATDNLTELLAGGGGLRSGVAIGGYLLLIGASAGAIVRLWPLRGGSGWVLATVLASILAGWGLLSIGTETVIVKYGRVFSALQFLLSTDRAHYAVGVDLFVRFAVAHTAVVLAVCWAHGLAMMGLAANRFGVVGDPASLASEADRGGRGARVGLPTRHRP